MAVLKAAADTADQARRQTAEAVVAAIDARRCDFDACAGCSCRPEDIKLARDAVWAKEKY